MRKISEYLKETREAKKLTLDNVENATKIKKIYLEAIERGNFNRLPSESYAQGFVKNYAKYLGIPASSAVPLFRREYESKNKVNIVPEFRRTQHKFNRKFLLSSRGLLVVGVILIVAVYIFVQYSSLFFPPELTIVSPKNGEIVDRNIVEVTGKTDPYATVTVDKDDVYVNLQGVFRKSEYLFSGDNNITVVSQNHYGKKTQKVINVKVK